MHIQPAPYVEITQLDFALYFDNMTEIDSTLKNYNEGVSPSSDAASPSSPQLPPRILSIIEEINRIHDKLKKRDLASYVSTDSGPHVAKVHNTYLEIMRSWNQKISKKDRKLMIVDVLNNSDFAYIDVFFSSKTSERLADNKAFEEYQKLLKKFPEKLKRHGVANDYTKGACQIVYDPQEINKVRNEVYLRLYEKYKAGGFPQGEAYEKAVSDSRIGVVYRDQYWTWIRDAVISPGNTPEGHRHTYNRLVWNCDLDRAGGAIVLPVIEDPQTGEKKIVLVLNSRHGTNGFQLEIPRGASGKGETPEQAGVRELKEEAGCVASKVTNLGLFTPDSGALATVVPVFLAKVESKTAPECNESEAILGTYSFTLEEIDKGFSQGGIMINIDGVPTKIPLQDTFLAAGIWRAVMEGLLPMPERQINAAAAAVD